MQYTIEPMTSEHGNAVIDVFNFYIENSFSAFPDKPVPYEYFERVIRMTDEYPAVVVKDETGKVAGFAFLHPYHSEETMKRTAEITYFLMPGITGKGIGTKILADFLDKARLKNIRTILAEVSSLNENAIRFHVKNGFAECGRFKKVGRKFGKEFDAIWMQRSV